MQLSTIFSLCSRIRYQVRSRFISNLIPSLWEQWQQYHKVFSSSTLSGKYTSYISTYGGTIKHTSKPPFRLNYYISLCLNKNLLCTPILIFG